MQTIKYGKCALILLLALVCSGFGATYTVSKDGTGMFTSIQEAVDAIGIAGVDDEIVIKDASVYEEQVTLDSTKSGLVLRSETPMSLTKPTIMYRDTKNVSPKTAAEALIDSLSGQFERNGALRIIGATGVRIEGIAVDGGGPYVFGADGIWNGKDAMQHGNAAITLVIAGEAIIRYCDISNAYFGINVKDRNVGGVFANPNPADIDSNKNIPFSRFAGTGNHLIENNRIHHNSVGMFFESVWDMGSTVRYNLIYENHHKNAAFADEVKTQTSDGGNQAGGAFMFKDHLLSPLAIYNNTLWHNAVLFLGHWKAGAIHLIFNNIFAEPNEYWNGSSTTFAVSFDLSGNFVNRMHNCVFAAQKQAPAQYDVQITDDIKPVQPGGGGTFSEGALVTPYPASADNRWVETNFVSTSPASPQFLTPDWSDAMVSDYIVDKGWEDAGVKDPDGSRADLGAIPSGGGRAVDVVTIRPTIPTKITGGTATIGFNITPRIGTMNTPLTVTMFGIVKNLDTSNCFGSDYIPITAANIQKVSLGTQTVQVGSNRLEVPVTGVTGDFAFFELIVEGVGSDSKPFTSAVGFIPYRKLDYTLDVTVLDRVGGSQINEVRAGETVVLHVEAKRAGNPFTNTIDPTQVYLHTTTANLYDPSGAVFSSIPGGIVNGTSDAQVVFTKVPASGLEYVFVAGKWGEVYFLGSSNGIKILAGPADSIKFQDPPSGMTKTVDPGMVEMVTIQAYDKYGNKVDTPTEITCSSMLDSVIKIMDTTVETDVKGLATFRAMVTNGDSGDVAPIHAYLTSKPSKLDDANLKVGQPRDRLWIFYGDTAAYNESMGISGCAGTRVPVVIRAGKNSGSISTDRATQFEILFTPTNGLVAYATATSGDIINVASLVNGEVRIWIQATGKNISNAQITAKSMEGNIVSGTRGNITFEACYKLISSAVYSATNGRGSVDRLDIYYDPDSPELEPTEKPDSLILYWPSTETQSRLVKTNIVIDPDNLRHVIVTLSEPFDEGITRYTASNANLGRAFWWNPLTPEAPTVDFTFPVEDGVGPLLGSATLIERMSAGNDTLIIDFTEAVSHMVVTGASLTLIKGSDRIQLNVVNAQPDPDNQHIIAVVENLGDNAPKEGDSLMITPEGPIVDAAGNKAHPQNRPVAITEKKIAPDIVSAVYRDGDANGAIDTVRMTFNKAVVLDSMAMQFSLDSKLGSAARVASFVAVEGSANKTIDVAITSLFNAEILKDKTFYTTPKVTVTFSNYSSNNSKSIQLLDGAAPVLMSVVYCYGVVLDTGSLGSAVGRAADTLDVVYTEPLKSIPMNVQPLLFQNSQQQQYSVLVDQAKSSGSNIRYRFVVSQLQAGSQPVTNDSSWINTAEAVVNNNVTDMAGNIQINPNNRKVAIAHRVPPVPLKVITGPRPFNPAIERVFVKVKKVSGDGFRQELYADMSVYDKVGNLVKQLPEDDMAYFSGAGYTLKNNGTSLYALDSIEFNWSGLNRSGRIVGEGTYIGIVHVRHNTMESSNPPEMYEERIPICVKKK